MTQNGAGSGQALKTGQEQAVTGKSCSKKAAASEHVRKKSASQRPLVCPTNARTIDAAGHPLTQKGAGPGQALQKSKDQAVTKKTASKKPAASEPVRKKPASRLPPGCPTNALTIDAAGHPRTRENVRLASDCSGLCTEFMAAMLLVPAPLEHVFASDTSGPVRRMISRFFFPGALYTGAKTRDGELAAPDIDLYVAGFPCQPCSVSGLMQGPADAKDRGTVIHSILVYISSGLPVSFILENVTGLIHGFPEFFSDIVDVLRRIVTLSGVAAYEVHWKVLDTKCEGGLPQSRPRVFIVGALRTHMRKPFVWPGPARRIRQLSEVLGSHVGNFDEVEKMPETHK